MPKSQMTGQSMALQRRDTGTKTNKYKGRKNTIKVKQQARNECNSRKDTKNKHKTRVHNHTGQCKRTGGCYNELVVAFFSTGGGVKGKKSIPVDFMMY